MVFRSPSSRRAWIEIPLYWKFWNDRYVALLAEGVDRNFLADKPTEKRRWVALLAEGVDRNIRALKKGLNRPVALLAEGVDRNRLGMCLIIWASMSPSSRRAWIEIIQRWKP